MIELLRVYLNCDLNSVDFYGQTLLFYSAKSGMNSLILFMCGHCQADPNIVDVLLKQTAIFYAASNGKHETVELLASFGADIDFMDEKGQTPLYWGINNGHLRVVESLVTKLGCRTNIVDQKNLSPIDFASLKK